jgi:hypothetical protein
MDRKASFVFDKRFIALAMAFDPIADLSAEFVVAGGRAM